MGTNWNVGDTPVNLLGNQMSGNRWHGMVPNNVDVSIAAHTYSKGHGVLPGDKFRLTIYWMVGAQELCRLSATNLFRITNESAPPPPEQFVIKQPDWLPESAEAYAAIVQPTVKVPKGATLFVEADSLFQHGGHGVDPGNCVIRIDVNGITP
jgi:hypothetical protein